MSNKLPYHTCNIYYKVNDDNKVPGINGLTSLYPIF